MVPQVQHRRRRPVVRISSAEDAAQKGDAVGVHPVAVVLATPCWPSACRSSATALSSTCGLCGGRLPTGGAIYAWVLEPVDDPDADGHGHDDHHDGDDPDGELAMAGAAGDDTEGEG